MPIHLKRAYDPPSPDDGLRVLVDRLWPRGLTKAKAHVDLWAKDVAPTSGLRQWFNHDPERWIEFQRRYEDELRENHIALETLRERLEGMTATLLYGARDDQHTHAIVLKRALDGLATNHPSSP